MGRKTSTSNVKRRLWKKDHTFDLLCVEVHPTGLDANAKITFCLAQALSQISGLVSKNVTALPNEVGRQDHATRKIRKNHPIIVSSIDLVGKILRRRKNCVGSLFVSGAALRMCSSLQPRCALNR